jgi:hypothetical protein
MRTNRFLSTVVIAAATAALASCGAVARHVADEATTELAEEVRDHVVDHAGGAPLASYTLLAAALHDVVDRDAEHEDPDSSFLPSYRGLDDADGDGLDDDGRVQIDVRDASSCLAVDGQRLRIDHHRC